MLPTDSVGFSEVLRAWSEVFMHRSIRDFKRYMDESGLSASQINVLMRLYYQGACSISEISAHLGVTNAASSQLVERLVQLDLLERIEVPTDRRSKRVSLAPKGRQMVESAIDARRCWMEDLTRALTLDEQKLITHALTLLTQAARQLDAMPECLQPQPIKEP